MQKLARSFQFHFVDSVTEASHWNCISWHLRSKNGRTPLHCAAEEGWANLVFFWSPTLQKGASFMILLIGKWSFVLLSAPHASLSSWALCLMVCKAFFGGEVSALHRYGPLIIEWHDQTPTIQGLIGLHPFWRHECTGFMGFVVLWWLESKSLCNLWAPEMRGKCFVTY